MDRRVIGLLVAGGILVVVVAVILIGRSGGSSSNSTAKADITVPNGPTVKLPTGAPPTQLQVKT